MLQVAWRNVFWLGFFMAILWAWWTMYSMGTEMGLTPLGRPNGTASHMDMPMTHFAPLAAMWAIMMIAMMFPTLVPTLANYEDLISSADGSRIGWCGVILGFALVWIGFAFLVSGTQMTLLRGGVVDMLGRAASPWVSGMLLVAVGAFQFTRAKEICHGVCRAPMVYFLGHWRAGFVGGVRMGAGLGCFCVGCCWGMMALGFVGGVMNLLWMGLATLFMVFEKLPQIGQVMTKPAGVALILGGIGVSLSPWVTGG